jgi:hypothetical protein
MLHPRAIFNSTVLEPTGSPQYYEEEEEEESGDI